MKKPPKDFLRSKCNGSSIIYNKSEIKVAYWKIGLWNTRSILGKFMHKRDGVETLKLESKS
jgi:lipid-A-disaccharide synthase-like uncharacterized protein